MCILVARGLLLGLLLRGGHDTLRPSFLNTSSNRLIAGLRLATLLAVTLTTLLAVTLSTVLAVALSTVLAVALSTVLAVAPLIDPDPMGVRVGRSESVEDSKRVSRSPDSLDGKQKLASCSKRLRIESMRVYDRG